MTGHDGPELGQLDLFGHPTTPVTIPAQRPPSRIESNDVDLMVTVAANAVRCGYLLVGAAERVYARADTDDHVARVPRYEEDAVHQLLRRRWPADHLPPREAADGQLVNLDDYRRTP